MILKRNYLYNQTYMIFSENSQFINTSVLFTEVKIFGKYIEIYTDSPSVKVVFNSSTEVRDIFSHNSIKSYMMN